MLKKITDDYLASPVTCDITVNECSWRLCQKFFAVEVSSGGKTVTLKKFTDLFPAREFAAELAQLLNRGE